MRKRNLPEARRPAGCEIAGREAYCAQTKRRCNSIAVDKSPHEHAAAGKSNHLHREWKRCVGAGNPKFSLNGWQRNHKRPHADAANCGK